MKTPAASGAAANALPSGGFCRVGRVITVGTGLGLVAELGKALAPKLSRCATELKPDPILREAGTVGRIDLKPVVRNAHHCFTDWLEAADLARRDDAYVRPIDKHEAIALFLVPDVGIALLMKDVGHEAFRQQLGDAIASRVASHEQSVAEPDTSHQYREDNDTNRIHAQEPSSR